MGEGYITIKEYNESVLGCPTTLGKYDKLYGNTITDLKIRKHEDIWKVLTIESKNVILYSLNKRMKDTMVKYDDFILVQNDKGNIIKAILRNGLKFEDGTTEIDMSDLIKTVFTNK